MNKQRRIFIKKREYTHKPWSITEGVVLVQDKNFVLGEFSILNTFKYKKWFDLNANSGHQTVELGENPPHDADIND